MLVDNVLIRPQGTREVSISWESATDTTRSYIFINGKFAVGPFMAEARNRIVVLPVPVDQTFKIEVQDFDDDNEIPASLEELPLVQPVIAWNGVESVVCYRIFHTIFDTGSIESLLVQVPPLSMDRTEIDCPVNLSKFGKATNGSRNFEGEGPSRTGTDRDGTSSSRWHYFRVETVDQFGHESVSEIIPYFAADVNGRLRYFCVAAKNNSKTDTVSALGVWTAPLATEPTSWPLKGFWMRKISSNTFCYVTNRSGNKLYLKALSRGIFSFSGGTTHRGYDEACERQRRIDWQASRRANHVGQPQRRKRLRNHDDVDLLRCQR